MTIVPANNKEVEMDFDYHKKVIKNLAPEGLQRIDPNDLISGEQWVSDELDDIWFENYQKNRPRIKPTINENWKDKTFIIVGSSPAIKRNTHFLSEVDDNFIIISSNAAAKYLVEMGIKVDFVFAIEGQHHIAKDFDFDTSGLTLVSSPNVSHEAMAKWKGDNYTYFLGGGRKYNEALLKDWAGKIDIDIGGGNVVSTAYLWAYKYLSARHIIVTGVSLCYYDDKPYYYDDREKPRDPLDYWKKWLKAIDMYGQLVTSTPPLLMYKTWLETYIQYAIAEGGGSFINATEDGILGVLPEPIKTDEGYTFEPRFVPWINITPLYIAIEGHKLRMEDNNGTK